MKGNVYCSVKVERSSSYLEQPVAPTVEGRDDGGVHVAAVQTLEVKQKRKRHLSRGTRARAAFNT